MKNNMKKWISRAVTLALLLTLLPNGPAAEAADTYSLYVGGVEITSENLTVNGDSGTATYNPTTHTLTLDNYSYTGAGYTDEWEGGGIDYRGDADLNVTLVGSSSIAMRRDSNPSHGIYFKGGTLTIDGEGSLGISFQEAGGEPFRRDGIFCEPGAFVMESGTVSSAGGFADESAGIYAQDGITINGGTFTGIGNPTIDWHCGGIYSHGTITINAGKVEGRAATNNDDDAYGFDGSVVINGGEVTASASSGSGEAKAFSSSCDVAGELLEMKVGDSEATATTTTNAGDVSGKKYVYIKAAESGSSASGSDPVSASYLDAAWNETTKTVDFTEKTADECTSVTSGNTAWNAGWYVVDSDVEITDRITVTGDVKLILCDDKTLNANEGIRVTTGNSLTIYGQPNGTGVLTAASTSTGPFEGVAGIGGNTGIDCGTITINGGVVTATGGKGATGIGGGRESGNGVITINGGTVTATGTASEEKGAGAGIGGGYNSAGGTITINGGTVTATGGGADGPGIGGGVDEESQPESTLTINGGTVTVTGTGSDGMGIRFGNSYAVAAITINGGVLTAAGNASSGGGSGIYTNSGITLTINGGNVTATGYGNYAGIGATPIGGVGGKILINGGTINATGYKGIWGTNITLGWTDETDSITATSYEGTVIFGDGKYFANQTAPDTPLTADEVADLTDATIVPFRANLATVTSEPVSYQDAAWNETTQSVDFTEKTATSYTPVTSDSTSWTDGWYVVDSDVTLSDRITVTGNIHLVLADGKTLTASKGIMVTSGNTLEIYGQSDGTGTLNAASSGSSAIGVGDGWGSPAVGDIVIYGGNVTATGNTGIGYSTTRVNQMAGTLTVYGGTVVASTNADGAGIGGAWNDAGLKTVTVYGGSVTANGGVRAAGIGGGCQNRDNPSSGKGGDVYIYGGTVIAKVKDGTTYGGEGKTPVAIGKGDGGSEDGSITLGRYVTLYGGTSESDLVTIASPYTDRYKYMKAVYDPPVAAVTFDANGHGTAPDLMTGVASGSTIAEPDAPTETGYDFGGWYKDADCTEAWDFSADTVTEDTTLYAKWTLAQYTVTVENSDNGTVTADKSTAQMDETVTLTVAPDAEYELDTLTVTDDDSNSVTVSDGAFTMPASNVTVRATFRAKGAQSITADEITVTYGDTGKSVSASTDGGGAISYAVTSGDAVTVDADGVLTILKAGTATVTVTAAESDSHGTTTKDVTVTVNKKTLTVTAEAKSKTYGEADPELTYTASGLVGSDALSGVLSRETGENVGTYAITQGTLSAGDNYALACTGADLTILPKEVSDPAVTVTPDSYTYDGTTKEPSVTVADGDTEIPASEYSVSYSGNTNAGTAAVTVTDQDGGNYIVNGTASFTITAAESALTVTMSGWTYGDTASTPTVTGNPGGGAVTYTYKSSGAEDDAYSAAVPVNAGIYTVRAQTAATDNYAAASAEADFTISKASLTATADSGSIVYGEEPKGFGITYAGFVNGDTESVVSGASYAFDYAQFGDVGTYTITLSGLSADNYEITLESGVLTVTPKTVGLEWGDTSFTYDGTEKQPAALATGLVNGDQCGVTVTGAATDAGSHTASVTALTGEKSGNYALPDETSQAYSITPDTFEVTAVGYSGEYDGAAHGVTVTVSKPAESAEIRYGTEAGVYNLDASPTLTDAGSLTVYYQVSAENYAASDSVETVTGTLTISIQPKTVNNPAITVTPDSYVYDGAAKEPAVTVKDGETEIPVSEYSVTYSGNTNAGTAAVTVTDQVGGNYIVSGTASFTINKATPAYTVPTGLTAAYGDTLSDVALPSGWAWDVPAAGVGNAGTGTFSATFTPSDTGNYNTVTETVSVTVSKSTGGYTVPTGLTATYGDTLSDVALPSGWAWNDSAASVGNAGTGTFSVTFTPSDTGNYNTVTETVSVTVNKASPDAGQLPSAVSGLLYNGAAHTLVTGGSSDDGVYHFRLGTDGAWSEALPSAVEAGNYTVYYYLAGDENHLDLGSISAPMGSVGTAITSPETPVISGKVQRVDEGTAIGGATVRLMRGSEEMASTVTTPDGSYQFTAEPGLYNIVVEWTSGGEALTKTEMITVSEGMTKDVAVLSDSVNSVLEVMPEVPGIIVGGLDAEAQSVQAEDGGSVVTVRMVVELSADDGSTSAIQSAAAGQDLDSFEIRVEKTVDSVTTPLTQTRTVLELVIPFSFGGKENVTIYRVHDGAVAALTESSSGENGTFWMDKANSCIHVYANQFSTYAVAYTQCYNITGAIAYGDYTGAVTVSLVARGSDTPAASREISLSGGMGAYSFTHIPKGTYTLTAKWLDGEMETVLNKEIEVR